MRAFYLEKFNAKNAKFKKAQRKLFIPFASLRLCVKDFRKMEGNNL
jgi:hypothetical protein